MKYYWCASCTRQELKDLGAREIIRAYFTTGYPAKLVPQWGELPFVRNFDGNIAEGNREIEWAFIAEPSFELFFVLRFGPDLLTELKSQEYRQLIRLRSVQVGDINRHRFDTPYWNGRRFLGLDK